MLKEGDLVSFQGILCLVVEVKKHKLSGCDGAVVHSCSQTDWVARPGWVNETYLEKISESR
jgi:hypothetical protein